MSQKSITKGRKSTVRVLSSRDVFDTLKLLKNRHVNAVILDPWYNRGIGGVRKDYDVWLKKVTSKSFEIADHVFVWGFPEIVCKVLDGLPVDTELTAWITWYYKNCPSIIRGWRPAQYTCLHLSKRGSRVYPENFMTEEQQRRYKEGKMRYIPGPPSVLEVPLNIGFIGSKEQTGHPAQKPLKTIEPLIKMVSNVGDTIVDPMCGAGTTGVACKILGRDAILCDESKEYVTLSKKRVKALS